VPLLPFAWGFARFLQGRFEEAAPFLAEPVRGSGFPDQYSVSIFPYGKYALNQP
jgi:hypothetical protein